MIKIKHVVSMSGGKDSTVTALIAIDRVGKENCRFIFCDTGNEHQAVYDYLIYLEQTLGITIDRLQADFSSRIIAKRKFIANDQRKKRDKRGRKMRWSNKAKRRALEVMFPTGKPFLDLCLWKGRFPSRKAQFCTEELKRNMAVAYQMELIDQGCQVVSWQGVRRDESHNRRNAKKIERIEKSLYAFRPLVDWTAEQVFDCHRTHGIEPNPLYKLGMSRVGCMPCINVNKAELRQIAARFPSEIERIHDWEILVGKASKHGYSTLTAIAYGDNRNDMRKIFDDINILSRIKWAMTTRGGRQFDLFAMLPQKKCSSAYGLCE